MTFSCFVKYNKKNSQIEQHTPSSDNITVENKDKFFFKFLVVKIVILTVKKLE